LTVKARSGAVGQDILKGFADQVDHPRGASALDVTLQVWLG
jgi:hypothetical protein